MIDILLGTCITMSVPHINNEVRFINIVTNDPAGAPKTRLLQEISTPYIDPPKHGWNYNLADTSPYYWDDESFNGNPNYKINNPNITTEEQVIFKDCPSDPRLKKGEAIEFTTCSFNTNTQTIIDCIGWALLSSQRVVLRETDNRELIMPLLDKWENE